MPKKRVERENTKSPATTGGRKKTAAIRSNGQITSVEPPPQQQTGPSQELEPIEINKKGQTNGSDERARARKSPGESTEDRGPIRSTDNTKHIS
ncbi:unnamed protein product, partial [Iphiclides podalirius]